MYNILRYRCFKNANRCQNVVVAYDRLVLGSNNEFEIRSNATRGNHDSKEHGKGGNKKGNGHQSSSAVSRYIHRLNNFVTTALKVFIANRWASLSP